LSTRFAAEGEKPTRQIIPAGTHLTKALLDKHGLKADDIEALIARGHVVEQSAHVVTEGDGPSAAELAAAEKRASDAEAKVTALEKQVADLTKAIEAATKSAAPVAGAAKA
jgi:hypothetical protein